MRRTIFYTSFIFGCCDWCDWESSPAVVEEESNQQEVPQQKSAILPGFVNFYPIESLDIHSVAKLLNGQPASDTPNSHIYCLVTDHSERTGLIAKFDGTMIWTPSKLNQEIKDRGFTDFAEFKLECENSQDKTDLSPDQQAEFDGLRVKQTMIATLSNGQYTITKISRDLFQRGDKVKKVEEKTIEQEVKIEPDVERYEVPASSQFSRGFDSIDAAISAEGLKYSETHPESQYAIVSFLMYTFIAEKIDETWYSIDTDGKHVRAPDAHRSLQKALEEKRKPPQESVPQTDDVPVPEPSKKPKTMNIGSNICASNIGWFDNINALTASIGPNLEQTRKDLKPKDHLNCFTVVYMKHQPFIVQYVDGWIAVDTEGNEVKHITDSQSSLRKFMVGEYVL